MGDSDRIERAIGRLEGKVEYMLKNLPAIVRDAVQDCIAPVEARVRKLENRKLIDTAAGAAGGVVGGLISAWAKLKGWLW